jgi:hypothetical protein
MVLLNMGEEVHHVITENGGVLSLEEFSVIPSSGIQILRSTVWKDEHLKS